MSYFNINFPKLQIWPSLRTWGLWLHWSGSHMALVTPMSVLNPFIQHSCARPHPPASVGFLACQVLWRNRDPPLSCLIDKEAEVRARVAKTAQRTPLPLSASSSVQSRWVGRPRWAVELYSPYTKPLTPDVTTRRTSPLP